MCVSSDKYIKRDLNLDIGFKNFEEDFCANLNTMFILPNKPKDKPIKIVFVADVKVTANSNDIEIKRKLSDAEAEKLLIDIFGTTNIGTLDFSDIEEGVYYCPTCQRILELTEIDSCMNTPNEIIDYCLKCHSEVVNLKGNI